MNWSVDDDAPLLTPVERPRTHEVILRQVEGLLASGRLAVGDRLPAERALADQLGVSRPSVREALKVLEALGVVEVTGGQGRESRAVVVARPAAALGTAMRLHVATGHLPVADLIETRVLLEADSVRRLAADADPALAEADALLLAMKDPALTPHRFHHLDTGFHLALAAAAGNAVVTAVMASLREAIEGYVLDAIPTLPDWSATARGLRRQHAGIVAAVRAGDPERAAAAVERHIRGFHGLTSRA